MSDPRSARNAILAGMRTCARGYIRNPRTARCVPINRRVGRALDAAARAAVQGRAPKPCKAGLAYDFAVGECVGDTYRVLALEELAARLDVVDSANASLAAKELTHRAFSKVKNTQHAAAASALVDFQRFTRRKMDRQGAAHIAQLQAKNAALVKTHAEAVQHLSAMQRKLAECTARLERSRQREKQLTGALLR